MGTRVSRNQEGRQNKLKKKKKEQVNSTRKVTSVKKTHLKRIFCCTKMKNKVYVKKPPNQSLYDVGWLARIPRVDLCER